MDPDLAEANRRAALRAENPGRYNGTGRETTMQHGDRGMYSHGLCRKECCRAAETRYKAEYRERKRQEQGRRAA